MITLELATTKTAPTKKSTTVTINLPDKSADLGRRRKVREHNHGANSPISPEEHDILTENPTLPERVPTHS
jgi:hypothetical protein